jgi:hypothetical protein
LCKTQDSFKMIIKREIKAKKYQECPEEKRDRERKGEE